MLAQLLRKTLMHPLAEGLDLDSAEATAAHADIIASKPFLQNLYRSFYRELASASERSPQGMRLEIGAGAGFMEDVLPGVRTLDLRPGGQVDVCASALELPFASQSLATVFMLDVLHHLPDLRLFFDEMRRTLKPGARLIMIEPYNTLLGKLIYTHLHHEPFDDTFTEWRLAEGGPMTASNQALPWIVFERDRDQFERDYPELEITMVRPHTMALYLLSGGLSMRELVPGGLFDLLHRGEAALLPALGPHLATMCTIELRRR
ncbi:MAG: SAM-dependent methyltransferase [Myxococcota bacterium]|jgi:SAM-dependent methyltransferase